MRPYTTDHLYHFVGRGDPLNHAASVETLRKILRAKCISHPPHEPGWGTVEVTYDPSKRLTRGELIVPNVVCFCDIPPVSLGLHMRKYGRCGISISRKHLLRHQGRPVMYFPYDPTDLMTVGGLTALDDLEAVYRGLRDFTDKQETYTRNVGQKPKTVDDLLHASETLMAVDLLAFLKPYDETLPLDHQNNYYMEREWRRLGNVKFEPENVGHVIVPPPFVDSLRAEFPEFSDWIVDTDSHANPPCDREDCPRTVPIRS